MASNSVKIADPKTFASFPTSSQPELELEQVLLISLAERSIGLLLLILLSPIFAVCAALVALSSPGPVIYKQTRVGIGGKLFSVLKFRSMVVDAESKTGATLSWKNDPRITLIGSVMRKLHLDELPQLWNVARGDMGLIGPRPERPEFVDSYVEAIPRYEIRHRIKPGITGLAQVSASYHARPEEKLIYDLHYLNHRNSIVLNLQIIWLTLAKILHIKGPDLDFTSLLPPSRQLESI